MPADGSPLDAFPASSRAPDAVLLDLGLPDMDGQEALSRLRAFSQVPVVVVSARDREAEKIAALDAGADDYVEKPFGVGELLARIRAALRHGWTQEGRQHAYTRKAQNIASCVLRHYLSAHRHNADTRRVCQSHNGLA